MRRRLFYFIADAKHVLMHANLWRVSDEFWDNWKSLGHEFTLAARWHVWLRAAAGEVMPVPEEYFPAG